MAEQHTSLSGADPYDLARFVRAQDADYEQAMSEIRERPEALALDVVHLPAVRRAGGQPDLQALCDQERC